MDSLYPGKPFKGGEVLVGNDYRHGLGDKRDGLLAVVRALKAHHGMNVEIVSGTEWLSGYLRCGNRSRQLATTGKPSIVRVKQGAGFLDIDHPDYKGPDSERCNIDSGDWAFLPKGLPFVAEGTIILGMNLQLWVAAVKVA